MKAWNELADSGSVERCVKALGANGMQAWSVESAAEAMAKTLDLLPQGAEVFTMSSVTIESMGLARKVNESPHYVSVRKKLEAMDSKTQAHAMKVIGAIPDYALGSVHAATEQGTLLVASNTGSQLPAYSYTAEMLILIIGAQKIVASAEEGLRRINEYIVPLESVRAREAYGLPDTWHTFPSKILTINRELHPGRIKIFIVNEVLGF